MSDDKKIFIDGFYSNEVADSLPDYILGKGSFHISKLRKFLDENEQYADNRGYLHYTIFRSKEAGNRYATLDLWKYNKEREEGQPRGYDKFQRAGQNMTHGRPPVDPEIQEELPVKQQGELVCNVCGLNGVVDDDGHDCVPF
jgi:hypothetical protein